MNNVRDKIEISNRILIVDDNHSLHDDYRIILCRSQSEVLDDFSAMENDIFGEPDQVEGEDRIDSQEYEVDSAFQGIEAVQMVRKAAQEGRPYALIFMDVRMPPGIDGIETISRIWNEFPYIEMVICTAYSDYSWDEIITRLGSSDKLLFMKKPFTSIAVKQMAHSLVTKWNLSEQSRRHTERLEAEVRARTSQLQIMLDDLHSKNEELMEAQADLRDTEEKFNVLTKSSHDGIVLIDNSGKVSFWNPAAESLFGYPSGEALGRELHNLIVPEAYRAKFKEGLQDFRMSGKGNIIGKTLELYACKKDGSEIPVEISVSALQVREDWYAAGIIRDITDRKKAEEDLKRSQKTILQQEKMASIGQLAAGVAHEINNPTGFVNSNLHTLEKYMARITEFLEAQTKAVETIEDKSLNDELSAKRKKLKIDYITDDIKELIQESLDGTDRIKNIVANLKGFARVEDAETKSININECLDATINIVWNELKYKCTLNKEYGDLPPTLCYPQQLSQVFVNLLVNASHAIEKQGEITISTRNNNGTNFISISDTGSGIPEDKVKRIFEPFFTTKEVGKGTGLGLSIAYDIIKKHSGSITVDSEEGNGTTFNIELPVAEEQE